MSRKEGPTGGSLLITEVNGKRMPQPLLIYGTPKLVYPYRSTEATDFLDFATIADARSCFFGNKWDGTNVLFFRYTDADGNVFISGKTKGSAFLNDCTVLLMITAIDYCISSIRSLPYADYARAQAAQGSRRALSAQLAADAPSIE